jgi:hypothetical protein
MSEMCPWLPSPIHFIKNIPNIQCVFTSILPLEELTCFVAVVGVK